MKVDVESLIKFFREIFNCYSIEIDEEIVNDVFLLIKGFGPTITQEELERLLPYFIGDLSILKYGVKQLLKLKGQKQYVELTDAEIKAYANLTVNFEKNLQAFDNVHINK